jgi:hypothetical protein
MKPTDTSAAAAAYSVTDTWLNLTSKWPASNTEKLQPKASDCMECQRKYAEQARRPLMAVCSLHGASVLQHHCNGVPVLANAPLTSSPVCYVSVCSWCLMPRPGPHCQQQQQRQRRPQWDSPSPTDTGGYRSSANGTANGSGSDPADHNSDDMSD